MGGSLGLGILVTVFAAAGSATLDDRHLFAHRVATSLIGGTVVRWYGGTVMLALALVVVVLLIVRAHKVVERKQRV